MAAVIAQMRLSSPAQSLRVLPNTEEKVSPGAFFQKSGFRIKGRDPVELAGVPLREGVSLTLLGVDMDHHGAGKLLGPRQHIAQAGQVMAVDGSQIGEAHILKESASRPQCLFSDWFSADG